MLDYPMIIDSFAGGGGASTGIEAALGRSPDVAINHNAAALALHAVNHPDTLHLDSNIWDVEPREVTKGRHVGLLWASPDCKHFSKAKGGAPRDRNIRDLAWVVVKWAEEARPDVICMENVEEFVTWGPVGEDGQPIKELAGITFELWIKRLKKAGYRVQWRELRACDFGAPTIRKRWFLVARRDGRPIRWPKPTHGDPKSNEVRKGKLLPWRTAAECIDWSLPCPSIFDTSAEVMAKHGLRAVRPLAVNTLARVARGMKRYVLESERPFIVNLTHGARLEDAAEPFRTITGAHRGEKAVVAPLIATMRNSQKPWQGADEPTHTITAGGAGLTLIAPSLANVANGKTTGRGPNAWSVREPLRTITSASGHAVTTPYLASIAHGDSGGRREYPMGEPLGTVTRGGIQHAVVQPHLLAMKGTARRSCDVLAPHPTVLAGGGHSALIAPVLTYAQQGGGNRAATDPHHTICASRKDQNSVMVAGLVQTGYGERPGQAPRALDVQAPLGTVVAGGAKHAPFAAFLAQQNGGPRMDGHSDRDPREPLSTVTAAGSQQTPVAAFIARQFGASTGHDARSPLGTVTAGGQGKSQLTAAFFAKYYGTGDGARHDEPAHTVTVRDRFAHTEAQLAAPPFAPEHHARAREVAEFLRAQDAWHGGEFVTLSIDGAEFVVVDIGLRMLTPRELFNAQGFPADYVIEGIWMDVPGNALKWHPFTKDVQVSCCGNSVCPPLAEAIVAANCGHLAAERQEATA